MSKFVNMNDDLLQSTDVFTVPASTVMKVIARRWLSRWWWLMVLAPAAALIASMFNPLWAVVALMLVMLVYPTALLTVCLAHALSDESRRAISPHHIEYDPAGDITLVSHPDENFPHLFESLTVTRAELTGISTSGSFITIFYGTSPRQNIIVTLDAFDGDTERLREFVKPVMLAIRQNYLPLQS